jgi:hypothetical protein
VLGQHVPALVGPQPAEERPVLPALVATTNQPRNVEPPALVTPLPAPGAPSLAAPPSPPTPTPPLLAALPESGAAPVCESHNYSTSVAFLGSPADAAREAQREQKLMFLLHISGNFEDKQFT